MRRSIWIVAGVLVFAVVAAQVLIPALGAQRIEDRLTAGGGDADVTLGAFPAARLLFSDGERIEVRARELDLDLDRETSVFDRLDGFDIVDIGIDDFRAGPFQLDRFELTRDGGGPYSLTAHGSATPASLTAYGFDTLDLPGEGIIDALLDPFVTDQPLALDLDMQVSSEQGRLRVVSGCGSVAGLPVGTLAELITSAIVVNV